MADRKENYYKILIAENSVLNSVCDLVNLSPIFWLFQRECINITNNKITEVRIIQGRVVQSWVR